MYISSIKELKQYKVNVIIGVVFLFFVLGISSRYIPNAHLVQKSVLLFTCIALIINLGFDNKYRANFFVYIGISVFCYLLSDQNYGSVKLSVFIKALVGFSLLYVILMVDFGPRIRSLSTAFVLLPIFMVIFSLMANLVFNVPISSSNGRFGAGLSSAHFAFLMYFVVVFLVYESYSSNRLNLFLLSFSFILLLLSGSRGPLIAALIPMVLLLKFVRYKSIATKLIIMSPLAMLVIAKFVMSIIERTKLSTFEGGGGINLSGREFAWEYFLNQIQGSNFFGGTLGAITQITEGVKEFNLYLFTVPHNEFIRFYIELGIVGVVVFFTNIFSVYLKTYKLSSYRTRRFLRYMFFGFFILTVFDNSLSTLQSFVPLALLLKYINFRESNNEQHSNSG
ncbi:O-antigen ligase family protein [Vibrio makurazakiensis]|uniref:O-antigen ligase family protein n=1 Tax=Vibrio makurazakiensis TaxID=2910250 RepID=UPI003D13F2A9